MSRKIMGLDLETTGLDHTKDQITEIGYAIYDINDFQKPFCARNFMLKIDGEVPDEIVELTGITTGHLKDADTPAEALNKMILDINNFGVQYVVAHNGNFDMGFLYAALNKTGIAAPNLELIDTAKDVPYPKEINTRTLRFLAVEHGFMNPFAHSAIFDVFAMMKVLSCYDFNDVLKYKNEPVIIMKAEVTYDTKELAKKAGFRWQECEGRVYEKTWVKAVKKRYYDDEIKTYPFGVQLL